METEIKCPNCGKALASGNKVWFYFKYTPQCSNSTFCFHCDSPVPLEVRYKLPNTYGVGYTDEECHRKGMLGPGDQKKVEKVIADYCDAHPGSPVEASHAAASLCLDKICAEHGIKRC